MMSEIPTAFESCIRVKGINLLPPIISEKRRIELQRFKQQAIKLEKRLQNCRELKKNLEELLNFQPLSERPQSAITFGDNSHIEALGINSCRSSNPQKKINLSKDIVDVTEYSNDGIKIIKSEIETNYIELNQGHSSTASVNKVIELNDSLSEASGIRLTSEPTCNKENIIEPDDQAVQGSSELDLCDFRTEPSTVTDEMCNISPIKSPMPRLIRSNSYILEAPSPILLAHLEKCSNKQEEKDMDLLNNTFSSHWTSVENNYVPFENSEFSSMNTVYNVDPNKNNDSGTEKNISPTIEIIQTDISVQQITVNEKNEHKESLENTFNLSNPDSQLMEVLQKIPENYSKQIIDLIEKQRVDPSTKKVETFKTEKQYLGEFPKKNTDFKQNKSVRTTNPEKQLDDSSPHVDRIESAEKLYSSSASISPSQSLYYSVSSSDTLVPNSPLPSVRTIDREYREDTINDGEIYDSGNSFKDMIDLYGSRVSTDQVKFNRELFPQLKELNLYDIKQHWAASVIGAHVKGYLTRRLLKTERVQSNIKTIKDALYCALQLHSDENIDKLDVELHRRLINQITAACCDFYDIFFSLPVAKQMSVIALDRKRKQEKEKRPLSAPISQRSRSNSRYSSSKSTTPQSRSLTKI